MLQALGGTSLSSISILWGLTLILFGLAAALDRDYPAWLGWTGLVVGAATFAGGTIQFLQPGLLPRLLVYALFPSLANLWTLALGVAMWHRAGTTSSTAA